MENQTLKFELSIDQVNQILGALGEIPFRISAPIIEELQKQAQPQLNAAPNAEIVPATETKDK